MNDYTYYDDGSYRGCPKKKRPNILAAVAMVVLAVLGGLGAAGCTAPIS